MSLYLTKELWEEILMNNPYNLTAKQIEQMREALMRSRLVKKSCIDCGEEFEGPAYVTDCNACCLSKILDKDPNEFKHVE